MPLSRCAGGECISKNHHLLRLCVRNRRFRRRGEVTADVLSLDNVGWYYKDLAGVEFGPFRSVQMRGWLQQGYFALSLPIRLGRSSKGYIALEKYFPVVAQAFPDSAAVCSASHVPVRA